MCPGLPACSSPLAVQGMNFVRDLLAIEVIATVNEAICQYHQRVCPTNEEMEAQCAKVLPRLSQLWQQC